jgi:uncharacterized repeat protein (TIGR01451 family)
VTYTITLHNNGPDSANNVLLTVRLPVGLANWSSPDPDVSYDPNTRTLTWSGIGTLLSNENAIRTFTARIIGTAAGTTLTTDATETHDEYPGTNTSSDALYVNKSPVTVTVTDNTTNGQANVGDSVTYTITLHNNGPDPAQNVYLKVMPLNLAFTYVSSSGGVYNSASRAIIWTNLGTIASGADLIQTFTLKIGTTGAGKDLMVKVFQNNLAQYGGVYGTDTIHVKKSVLAMSMTNNAPGGIAHIGNQVTYTINIQNNGLDSADNVTVKVLPLNFGFNYISSNGTFDLSTRTIIWNIGTIPSGTNVVLTYTLQVNNKAKGSITNTAAGYQTGYTTNPKATSTITIT